MKRFFVCLIFAFFVTSVFAQNIEPYTVDLSKLPIVNEDKTVTFDKKTNTITIKKDYLRQTGISIWLGQEISSYNILRIKYKALVDDIGFFLFIDYKNDNLDDYKDSWWDRNTYCPSYLTEMIIPLKNGMKNLNSLGFFSLNSLINGQFIIESITLEKVANPVKTDIWATNVAPVIDTATKGTIDEKLTAWDFVPQLGVGYHYIQFLTNGLTGDTGHDFYNKASFKKPSKEEIKFIKEKGFTTVRLQTCPGAHMLDERYTIAPEFLRDLKQCVDWFIEEGLYVIIAGPRDDHLQEPEWQEKLGKDVHYACYNVSEKDEAQSKEFLKAVWLQYAQAFNNSYDEHLIFETLDEPAAIFHEHAWNPDDNCATCKKNFAILNEYNQLIVDTIRSTGGNNANRFIMVEGLTGGRYWLLAHKLFKLPKDKVKNKIIPSLHNYPMPFDRTIYTEGIKKFFITDCFAALDKYYFKKKIPVYFTEVGHSLSIPILERIKGIKDFMAEVKKTNRSCAVSLFDCYSDSEGGTAYDIRNSKWNETEYVDTLLYAAQGKEYPLSEDFIKKNEVKVESIAGKNILKQPVQINQWDNTARINPDVLAGLTSAKYKLVFEIERIGSDPILAIAYQDFAGRWHDKNNTTILQKLNVKGGILEGDIKITSDTVELTVNEQLAKTFESSDAIILLGQQIIIKSVKVVE